MRPDVCRTDVEENWTHREAAWMSPNMTRAPHGARRCSVAAASRAELRRQHRADPAFFRPPERDRSDGCSRVIAPLERDIESDTSREITPHTNARAVAPF